MVDRVSRILCGEEQRLTELARLGELATEPDDRFDHLEELTAIMLNVPIALISLVDRGRRGCNASLKQDVTQTERELAFCSYAIREAGDRPFVVADTRSDARFADNPFVTNGQGVRFYAGQVLRDPDGLAIGTLCALDRKPRELTDAETRAFCLLATMVEQELERQTELELMAELAVSAREKSLILDTLTEGIVMQGSDGRIQRWNPAAERLLGLSADELSGRTSTDPRWRATHADGSPWPGDTHPAMVALRSGKTVREELMDVRHPNGDQVWLRVSSQPIASSDGNVTGVVTAFADATAEIAANKTSAALDERLRAAIETSPIGTALLDVDRRATYVNEAYASILGLEPHEILGRTFTDFVHPDDRELGRVGLEELKSGARLTFSNEVRLATSDATTRWIGTHRTRVSPVEGEVAYLIQIEDVTVKRRLEADLQRSEETGRVSLNSLEQGVILVGSGGVIRRINPAAEQLLGYTAEELTSLWATGEWASFDEDGSALAPERRPILRARTGETVIGETVGWQRRDGQRLMIRISCIPDADGAGELLIAFTDITEQHRAKRLLDATLDTAPVGLAILDLDRRIVRCNSMFARQAGEQPADLVGTDVFDVLHPQDRPDEASLRRSIRSAGRPGGQLVQRIVRPDGSMIWVNTNLAVIDDPDRPLAIAATFDVTEERRMTQELSRFSYLFEHANDVITVIGADGQVLYASPSSERILGYPDGYRHPNGILGLVHPDDVPATAVELTALINGIRGPEPFTLRVRGYDGEWRHMECVGVNLLDEPAVAGIVITARDTTERERLTRQLTHSALHDTLTDLPNRSMLDKLLTQTLASAARDRMRFGLCFVDLDGFKSVNDTLGHAAGDRHLIEIADRIRRVIRPGDTAARIGGDEFVIILDPVSGAAAAFGIAARIRDAITRSDLVASAGVRSGASVGLTLSRDDDTPSTILGRADAALYRAKAHRNSSIEMAPGDRDER